MGIAASRPIALAPRNAGGNPWLDQRPLHRTNALICLVGPVFEVLTIWGTWIAYEHNQTAHGIMSVPDGKGNV